MADREPSFKPVSGNVLPRFAGTATFMRLPHLSAPEGIDIGLIGVPWDGGTANRAGARHGPRPIRDLSTPMRNVHHVSGIKPFELCKCADLGDTPVNPIDLEECLQRIEDFFARVHGAGVVPLSAGGDHLVTLPIMRAIAKDRPLGMVHFDAHTDTWDRYFGDQIYATTVSIMHSCVVGVNRGQTGVSEAGSRCQSCVRALWVSYGSSR